MSNAQEAFVDSESRIWNGSEWVDVFGESAILTVGGIYTLYGTNTTANAPIKAVCVQMDETNNTAVMQSYGFGHGSFPGTGTFDASTYGTTVGNFNISGIQLANGTSTTNLTACGVSGQSSLIFTALVGADNNYSSFGADYNQAWLGTRGDGNKYRTVHPSGVSGGGSTQSYNMVVAPCFILKLSNVKLKDNILYAK